MLTVSETPLSELIPYANNAKQHTEAQIKQIAASIQEYGFNDPIAVWHDEDGHPVIVEGHGRALAAERLHMDTVPTISLDNLTDTQRRQYTLVHNQLTMTTGWDLDMLNAEIDALQNTWDATVYDFHPMEETDLDELFEKLPDSETWAQPSQPKEIECPHCGNKFTV